MRARRVPLEPSQRQIHAGQLSSALFRLYPVFLIGAVLLYDGFHLGCNTNRKGHRGAAFLSLGLMALWLTMKRWVQWKRDYKNGGR